MNADLLLPYLQKEIIEGYFEICRYLILSKNFGQAEDQIRLNYYKSFLLADPLPVVSVKNKLDLEIISATKEVKSQLSDTYSPEFIINIINSGIHIFFDRMERYAAIDVHLRSMPELFAFFNTMSPIILRKIQETVHREFAKTNLPQSPVNES